MEKLEKILDNLAKLKYKGRVEFYIYNEPTRDKRLPDILKMFRVKLPRSSFMVNTNGDYFKSAQDIKLLFDSGLNQMQINIYSDKDNSADQQQFEKGVAFATSRMAKLQAWVDELFPKSNQEVNPTGKLNLLYHNIGSRNQTCVVVKKFGIRPGTDVAGWTNRSGLVPDFKTTVKEPLKKGCTKVFRMLNLDYMGNAVLCCNDFNSETKAIGNISDKTLEQMWNDKIFNIYRLKLQNKYRAMPLCSNCDFNGGVYTHLIDKATFGSDLDSKILTTQFKTIKDIEDYELQNSNPVV
jgi:radical SAM protein with 4Fe4S-binding SPASM domain